MLSLPYSRFLQRSPQQQQQQQQQQQKQPASLPTKTALAPSVHASGQIASLTTSKPVKQGWVLKKAGSGLFAHWRQKYLVLSLDTSTSRQASVSPASATAGPAYVLSIYDDRDLSKPPKHEIVVADMRVDTGDGVNTKTGASASGFSGLRKGTVPFVLFSNKRKFHLAAQTQTDREEWLQALAKAKGGRQRGPTSRSHNSNNATNNNNNNNSGHQRASTSTTQHMGGGGLARSLSRHSAMRVGGNGAYQDEDAKSMYSVADSEYYDDELDEGDDGFNDEDEGDHDDDDAMSVVSTVSRVSTHAHVAGTDDDNHSFASSGIDTLSFCSEPVLTPYELTLMGDPSLAPEPKPVQQQVIRKRRAPMQLHGAVDPQVQAAKTWNDKYQTLLSMRAITLEAALQRDVQLMELIGAFRETAAEHAMKIIDEYHVQGGLLGSAGSKNSPASDVSRNVSFTHDNIFFQFACEYDASKPEDVQEALNRSSRELKGVDSALQAACRAGDGQIPILRTILMALVDYKGFRVIAHADIGANEQMIPVHDLNPEHLILNDTATEYMAIVGREMNLKQHAVQVNADRRVQVPLSATVEVHLDQRDNGMYLTCLHEIFPVDHYVEDTQPASQSTPSTMPSSPNGSMDAMQQGVRNLSITSATVGRYDYGDTHTVINGSHRLRPEFLAAYQTGLCADGLTPTAGASRREKEVNDGEVSRACRFLRETWIPAFVRSLDNLDARPFDSQSMAGEMHRNGINSRYLGMVCSLSTIPYIRNLCLVEMVARVVKRAFRDRLRNSIIHFRAVGATHIDEQMKAYATNVFNAVLGNGDKSRKFFEERVVGGVQAKYNYDMTYRQFAGLHRAALFHAMQYHCGVEFDDTLDYDFVAVAPVQQASLRRFVPRIKSLTGLPQVRSLPKSPGNSLKEEERLAYLLARHFKGTGPKSKLSASIPSATSLCQVAAHYNGTSRFEEARLYAQASVSSAPRNHIIWALASAQLLYAHAGLQSSAMGAPDPTLITTYRHAVHVAEWHWGPDSPLVLCLHDRMSLIYHRAKDPARAIDYTRASLDIVERSLGKNHVFTAAYLTKTACFLQLLGSIEEAVERLTQALTIYQSQRSDGGALISEVHYHLAQVLSSKGDLDSALMHAQTCRKLRERLFGFSDIRVIEACRLVAELVLSPYASYRGVLTPQIKAAYREAIACHEKVFRYLKAVGMGPSGGGSGSGSGGSMYRGYSGSMINGAGGLASGASSVSIAGTTKRGAMIRREATLQMLDRSGAAASRPGMMSTVSLAGGRQSAASFPCGGAAQQGQASLIRTTCLLGTSGAPSPISGPLITPPYGWPSPLSRSLLHSLTKEIVAMKLALIESPKHRECVRMLRSQRAALYESLAAAAASAAERPGGIGGGSGQDDEDDDDALVGLDPDEARNVILRLAAVSPSVYLDGILQRIDDEDESAVEELRVVLMLTESDTVGLAMQ